MFVVSSFVAFVRFEVPFPQSASAGFFAADPFLDAHIDVWLPKGKKPERLDSRPGLF